MEDNHDKGRKLLSHFNIQSLSGHGFLVFCMPQTPLPMEVVGDAGEFHRNQIADLTSTVNRINDEILENLFGMSNFTPLRGREVILAAYTKLFLIEDSVLSEHDVLHGLGIFCKHCLLSTLSYDFLKTHDASSRPQRLLCKGGRNFSKVSDMLKDHCLTLWHVDATALFIKVNQASHVDRNLFSESAIEESLTKKFFVVLFNAVLFLMRQNLAFRSAHDPNHSEVRDAVKNHSFLADNAGNFAELIVTIARMSGDAAAFITQSRKHLLSPLIQKRICFIIAEVVRGKIYALMHKNAWSLYVDESQDTSLASQLVVAARFYDITSGHPKEVFLTFLHLPSQTAASIFDAVVEFLENAENPLDVKYMVGACSDGCNTMFGHIGGFMTLLAAKYEGVFTIKRLLHGLNLAVVRACSFANDGHVMIQNAVAATDHIVRWIAASGKRNLDFCAVMREVVGLDYKKFKQLARVRWLQRIEGAVALVAQMHGLIELLQLIGFDSEKYSRDDSRKDAQSFKLLVQNHSFLFGLTCVKTILSIVSDFTSYAQSERIDFACVTRKLECAIQDAQDALRNLPQWCEINIFDPVDKLRFEALTHQEQITVTLCAGRKNVDVFIPVGYPRGAVVSSRHGTTTPLPGLPIPQQQRVDESSDDFIKRRANGYFQVEIIQPMLETMRSMMKDMNNSDSMKELHAIISSLLVIDIVPLLFPSLGTIPAILHSDSEESSDDEVITGTVESVEPQKHKKSRLNSKKEARRLKRLEDDKRYRSIFILKYESAWRELKSTPQPKQMDEWQKRLAAGVRSLKQCLLRVGNDRVKDLLSTDCSIMNCVKQYIRSWTAMSIGDAYDISTLSRMMNVATSDDQPLFYNILCICVTLGVANAKSERCFSAMNLIKTKLRSCMGDPWLNDLAVVSINRDVVVTYEEFLACLEKKFPLDKFWH